MIVNSHTWISSKTKTAKQKHTHLLNKKGKGIKRKCVTELTAEPHVIASSDLPEKLKNCFEDLMTVTSISLFFKL